MKGYSFLRCILPVLLAVYVLYMDAAGTEKIRIMTYNIPYGNINSATNTWEQRAIHLAEYINRISPDIMGWQEPVRNELIDLLHRMPGYAMVGHGRDNTAEKGEYTPIIYKTERFFVEASGNYWLTDTPEKVSRVEGAGHNRIATWAVLVDKQTGARFLYTNTHLSYENEEVKEAQIKYMKPHMLELSEKYYGAGFTTQTFPHLLTGDMNMKRTEETNYNYIKNYKLVLNDMRFKCRTYKNLCSGSDDNCIDYIYATSKVSCTTFEWGNSYTDDGYRMSDHHPVWADLYWPLSNEDNARASIMEAYGLLDSLYTYTEGRVNLAASRFLSCDGAMSSCPVTYVVDNKTSTYYQTLDNMPPNQPHFIQVELNRELLSCRFQYNPRYDSTEGIQDRMQDVMVTASEDGISWDYITEFTDFGGDALKAYTSSNIFLRKPNYKYLRFNVMRTPGYTLRNGAPQFSCSEFRLFQNTPSAESLRYVPEISAEADLLEGLIDEVRENIAARNITKAKLTALQDAIQALRVARDTYLTTGINPASSFSFTPAQGVKIYSTDGLERSNKQKGLNIVSDTAGKFHKVYVKP